MPIIRLPTEHDLSYVPARGPVLLLTCMDLRVLDEIVQFMDHDGLTNRYDHVIFAGAALGALGGMHKDYQHWRKCFFDHLYFAYKLHHIKDVYILEHRDCGAYREFLGAEGSFDDAEPEVEEVCHYKYAMLLTGEIETWAKENDVNLHVRSFLMDLRGKVSLMHCPTEERVKAKKKGKKKRPQ